MTIFIAPANPWAAATINAHPRVLVTPTRIARLQSRWSNPTQTIGASGKTWASLQSAWNAESGNAASAIPEALKYLATGNPTYATNAFNACSGETFISASGISGNGQNMHINASGVVLDWCYPALTTGPSGQRATLINNCQSFVNSARTALQANGGFDIVGPANNTVIANYIMNALAAEGESGFTSELANVRTAVQNALTVIDQDWGDGAYRAYEYTLIFNWLYLDAYFTATSDGEALMLQRSSHMRSHGDKAARMLWSDLHTYAANGVFGGYRAATGQSDVANEDIDDAWQLAICSDIDRNPVTKWLADTQLANCANTQGYTCSPPWSHQGSLTNIPTYLALLYYDDTLVGQSPSQAGMPTSSATMPSGTVSFRGGWNHATDLVGNYNAGPFTQNDHDSINIGCLTLRVGGRWMITDDSAYGGSPSTYGPGGANGAASAGEIHGYTMRSSGVSYTPTATAATREDRDGSGYNQSNTLPPGQGGTYPLYHDLSDAFRKVFDTGTIVSFSDDGTTALFNTDLTKGFPITTQALCNLAFVRGASSDLGTVAIWDQFTITNSVGPLRRNFHTLVQPITLNGTQTLQQGSSTAGIFTSTGTTAYWENGGYRCTVQCVSQLDLIDIIGGSGFEGWYDGYALNPNGSPLANGKNLPYSGNTQQSGTQQRVINSTNWINNQWRVSFRSHQTTNTNSEMLHVVTVTRAGVAAPVYTNATAKALFSATPPPPPPPPSTTPVQNISRCCVTIQRLFGR